MPCRVTSIPSVAAVIGPTRDPCEALLLDDPQGTPRNGLLSWLEEQPHGRARFGELRGIPGERETRPQRGGRVDIVAACVGHAIGAGSPRQAGPLDDRQGIQVGPQGDPVCRVVGPEIGQQTGPGEAADPQACVDEPITEQFGGSDLMPGQLGVGMDIAADRDQLRVELGQRRLQCW